MTARDSARTLELVIRGAVAEERLLGARLARMAETQRKTRDEIAAELRRERFGHPAPAAAEVGGRGSDQL